MRSAGTRYFFLSMVGMSLLSAFSQMTCLVVPSPSVIVYVVADPDQREEEGD